MVADTHEYLTPPDIYTYLENGTFITYDGGELILQNEKGTLQRSALRKITYP